jgi:hypothetical protein
VGTERPPGGQDFDVTFRVLGFRERSHCGAELPVLTASGSTPLIDSNPVRAVWDARCVRLSEQLHGLAEQATVVDDAYVAAGLAGTHNRSTLGGGPEAVMLTLINCCDALGVVEYSSAGLGAGLRGEWCSRARCRR